MKLSENELSFEIIGCAIEVHKEVGPGLLESAYEECLCHELRNRRFELKRQLWLPLNYRGATIKERAYRVDILIDGRVVVDVKSVEQIHPVHEKQVLTYLKLMDCRLGLVLNFNVPVMKKGVHRVVNGLRE